MLLVIIWELARHFFNSLEWDDPNRGKHKGNHKGIYYFTTNYGSGSFVKSVNSTRNNEFRRMN